jgi:hypothetical protein
MRMRGAFWMICRIFNAIDRGSLDRLVLFREFLDTFVVGIFDLRKLLQITRLPGALGPGLACAVSKFIELGLIVPTRSIGHEFLLNRILFRSL